jgi:hypothetical protein
MLIPSPPIAMAFYVLVEAVGGTPTIDVEATCRASERATAAEIGEPARANVDNCLRQEQAARDQLNKGWADYAVADKAQCVQPTSYLPSYVEWLTCLDDAKTARNLAPAGMR